MTKEDEIRAASVPNEPVEDYFASEIDDGTLAAHEDERFLDPVRRRRAPRVWFLSLVAIVMVIHAAIIAAFLWRDANTRIQVAQIEEIPVEIVVEPPPEPPKPPPSPPQKQPPPKPKEDLSPALSAPRAQNDDQTKMTTKEAKTAAPTKLETPTKAQPQANPAAAPPKEASPADTSKEEAAKEEDKTKPDAEALDKAKPKVVKKEDKAKEAKAAPKTKKVPNALAALSGAPNLDATMTFTKPTPKTPIYGGTEDVRYLAIVQAMLESKVTQLPRTTHWRDGGHVVIFFHVDESGRVISRDFYQRSGYPDIDQIAMQALLAAAPFPPPPRGLEHGLLWGSKFDGQLPRLTVNKR